MSYNLEKEHQLSSLKSSSANNTQSENSAKSIAIFIRVGLLSIGAIYLAVQLGPCEIAEAITADFSFRDAQLGLMGGAVFAVLQGLRSLPVAADAERFLTRRLLVLCLRVFETPRAA